MLKITRKLSEIKQYRESRNDVKDNDFMQTITMNLITNLADRNNFIHKQLDDYKSESKKLDNNLKIITGLYICSLITCWETFFRDLFIFLCNKDNEIKKSLESNLKDEIPLDLTIGEYNARKFNFQNLRQTREAFDFILERETVSITDYFTQDVFNGVINPDYVLIIEWITEGTFKDKVNIILEKAFNIRHRVTHDANYLIDFDSKLLSQIEAVFQVIPQFFIGDFAKKYNQKRLVFDIVENSVRITDKPNENELNYAFSSKDFMAEDYYILPE
ncbi:hypothetical protein J2Q11_14010 [Tenacibaculum finnmarkense genomovar finnmarkense]|uniref:hypothetical protein n=1 Tax=Tenacibaculum finnmarkense TaxID=2781243 RepID=UPI001E5FC4E0|nr:hypothetical protein [Tenacibaculum finnmarkense]MCD8418847.1 hypothetical protein [Tenacibaculum finnmarkense genomovar finnmarkense]MCG8187136.1 hypothetical protein [Tenacibaculum finnmarkense genomovar finnmarkense]MCG8203721.1 hypothetical protein [Tenacibaculum finnmarkense genomovar finnmarkense]MCG8211191.1 hypothetical protein [Tenacibaculum finnmarkense genomovar finnmarkense]MCG8213933.1 hypothetical protein [Tenacibaculum finnmarkense genomovar finnmarkense]